MPTFEQTIDVAAPLEEAFLYVADFRTATEWDPGIVQSRRVNNGPIGKGATYDVTAVFRGSRVPFRYELVEYEENRRLLFHAAGAKARATDELRFEGTGEGTRIAYRAVRTRGRSICPPCVWPESTKSIPQAAAHGSTAGL